MSTNRPKKLTTPTWRAEDRPARVNNCCCCVEKTNTRGNRLAPFALVLRRACVNYHQHSALDVVATPSFFRMLQRRHDAYPLQPESHCCATLSLGWNQAMDKKCCTQLTLICRLMGRHLACRVATRGHKNNDTGVYVIEMCPKMVFGTQPRLPKTKRMIERPIHLSGPGANALFPRFLSFPVSGFPECVPR